MYFYSGHQDFNFCNLRLCHLFRFFVYLHSEIHKRDGFHEVIVENWILFLSSVNSENFLIHFLSNSSVEDVSHCVLTEDFFMTSFESVNEVLEPVSLVYCRILHYSSYLD